MAAYLVDLQAVVQCSHVGQAKTLKANLRVKVDGKPVITQTSSYAVTGCSLASTGATPCATGRFRTAATRVKAGGEPVVLADSQSTCIPTGNPLVVLSTQKRVKGL
jgi:hypothetical protein